MDRSSSPFGRNRRENEMTIYDNVIDLPNKTSKTTNPSVSAVFPDFSKTRFFIYNNHEYLKVWFKKIKTRHEVNSAYKVAIFS